VGYSMLYRPLKSLWRRHREKFGEISKDKLNLFGGKSDFSASVQGKLVCEVCRASNVNIIYECGHLCICEACHKDNLSQQCPICRKVSAQSIKIFL
jgi:rubrerythrin